MSQERSAVHSSRSSVRYSPYSRLSAPATARRSSVPSGQHSPPSDGGGTASYLSPTSVYPNRAVSHPSAPHPNHLALQRSLIGHPGLELSGFPNSSFPQESAPITQIPSCPPAMDVSCPRLFQQSANPTLPLPASHFYPPQPTANVFNPDSTSSGPARLPSNPHLLHAPRPSIALRRPEDFTDRNFFVGQQPLKNPKGYELTVPVPQPTSYQAQGMFSGSHNLSFSDNTFIDNSTASGNFMEKFLQYTIIGAEFDSSDRHPPPRCHPGTRLAIVARCKAFVIECNGNEKMRWVVGPAGVGKSAIMQMVAEEAPADASVFFSINGRHDGKKLFTTIAYQLATKHDSYYQFMQVEISRDPTLLSKALPVQFQKFIVEPFIRRPLFHPSHRFLIVIDGLDECNNPLIQRELLELISEFNIAYPISPVVWLIASRPEPHITSFFEDANVTAAFTKEAIMIDSDEACEDVQRYLRDELKKIKCTSPTLKRKREWPCELDFTKIATAAGGLFAYASTVVRYIGDPHYRDPVALLDRVLEVIDASSGDDVSGTIHPMAHLDALYSRILHNVPAEVMINTRKLLLFLYPCYNRYDQENFRSQCNRLELGEDTAYGAISHLHAVVDVPTPDDADDERLEFFHKSFADFLFDFKRSGFCHNVADEVAKLHVQSSLKIVEQVSDKFDDTAIDDCIEWDTYGWLKSGPGFCDDISLSWPGDERFEVADNRLRLSLYCTSMARMCYQFTLDTSLYRNISFFHLLTTCFVGPGISFPYFQLRESTFDNLNIELTDLGELKQVPLRALDFAAICGRIDVQFTSLIEMGSRHSDFWDPSCEHEKRGEDPDGSQPSRSWSTSFERFLDDPGDDTERTYSARFSIAAGEGSHWGCVNGGGDNECLNCSRRFAHHFINNPDQLATVYVDSTEMCYVELSFVDSGGQMSEWRYRFFHSGHPSCTI